MRVVVVLDQTDIANATFQHFIKSKHVISGTLTILFIHTHENLKLKRRDKERYKHRSAGEEMITEEACAIVQPLIEEIGGKLEVDLLLGEYDPNNNEESLAEYVLEFMSDIPNFDQIVMCCRGEIRLRKLINSPEEFRAAARLVHRRVKTVNSSTSSCSSSLKGTFR